MRARSAIPSRRHPCPTAICRLPSHLPTAICLLPPSPVPTAVCRLPSQLPSADCQLPPSPVPTAICQPQRTGPRFPSPPRRGDLRVALGAVPTAVCLLPTASVTRPDCHLPTAVPIAVCRLPTASSLAPRPFIHPRPAAAGARDAHGEDVRVYRHLGAAIRAAGHPHRRAGLGPSGRRRHVGRLRFGRVDRPGGFHFFGRNVRRGRLRVRNRHVCGRKGSDALGRVGPGLAACWARYLLRPLLVDGYARLAARAAYVAQGSGPRRR